MEKVAFIEYTNFSTYLSRILLQSFYLSGNILQKSFRDDGVLQLALFKTYEKK